MAAGPELAWTHPGHEHPWFVTRTAVYYGDPPPHVTVESESVPTNEEINRLATAVGALGEAASGYPVDAFAHAGLISVEYAGGLAVVLNESGQLVCAIYGEHYRGRGWDVVTVSEDVFHAAREAVQEAYLDGEIFLGAYGEEVVFVEPEPGYRS